MKELSFSKFAQIMYSAFSTYREGKDMSGGDFVYEMFSHITNYKTDEPNPLDDKFTGSSYRNYFGGHRGIRDLARAIRGRVDRELFSDFVFKNVSGDMELNVLYDELHPYMPSMDRNRVPEGCADIFVQIIKRDGEGKHRAKDPDQMEMDLFGSSKVPINDLSLLREAHGKCPRCGRPLTTKKDGVTTSLYKAVDLIPDRLSPLDVERYQNTVGEYMPADGSPLAIALCLTCAEWYKSRHSPEEARNLAELAFKLRNSLAAEDLLFNIDLDEKIDDVLVCLAQARDIGPLDPVKYDVYEVDRKMKKGNELLGEKIKLYVTMKYAYVQTRLRQLSDLEMIDPEELADQFKSSYRRLAKKGLTQEEVFDLIVDWALEKTESKNKTACEVVVAYYVQDCEVFVPCDSPVR